MTELHPHAFGQEEILAILETTLPLYHNPVQLASSPLARWQVVHRTPGQQVGNRVQAVLSAAIDALRPAAGAETESSQGRAYLLLDALYRRDMSPKKVYEDVLQVSKSQFYRERQRALSVLADMLRQREIAAAEIWQQALPYPTYTRTFGFDGLVAGMLERLADQQGPALIVIDGVGGIGKTALARESARWALRSGMFAALVWQTAARAPFAMDDEQLAARPALTPEALLDGIAQGLSAVQWANLPTPEKLAAINRRLAEHPTLLIVDNLETVTDGRALLDILQHLARTPGTRVLVTSRHRLENFDPLASVHMQPLGLVDTLALLRHTAAECDLPALADAADSLLQPAYAITGGYPLAVRLVVGLASTLPWKQVLLRLEHPSGIGEQFYRFIHRRLWELLSEDAQQALFSLPHLALTGARWDELLAVSGLEVKALSAALAQLKRFSLVNSLGTGLDVHYCLHPLTLQFILSDLVGYWPQPEGAS